MDKKVFSIVCTTCHARLAVRSASAIGTIVECPRCQSMVQVLPPPGWAPPAPSPTVASSGLPVPPPLDRVATVLRTLELETSETISSGGIFGRTWLLWSLAALVTVVAVVGIWRVAFSSSASEPIAVETKVLLSPVESAAREAKREPVVSETKSSPGVKSEERSAEKIETAETPARPEVVADVKPVVAVPEKEPRRPVDATRDAADVRGTMEVKKTPAVYVDVASRMADRINGLEWAGVPLNRAIEILASLGALPITLDAEALQRLGITAHDPVSLNTGVTTVGEVLKAVAAQKGLAVRVENDQVLVTSPAEFREAIRAARYSMDDLTADAKSAAGIATLIQKLVAPASWLSEGGRGGLQIEGNVLVVNQSSDVQRQVLDFCERLRVARHLPLRSVNPKAFTLVSRVGQARKMLEHSVTANFHEPTPLARVLAFLSRAGSCDILVDRVALSAAETSDRVEATLTVRDRMLRDTLDALLRPLGLTYVVVDATTVEVTTHEAADDRVELEFYPVGSQLSKGMTGEILIERLRAQVLPTTWREAGGLGEAVFDGPSNCVIVLQTQAAQAAIERWMGSH